MSDVWSQRRRRRRCEETRKGRQRIDMGGKEGNSLSATKDGINPLGNKKKKITNNLAQLVRGGGGHAGKREGMRKGKG